MNEALGLIEQLAVKLGTTADQMWAVLLGQAPINGIINIFQYVLICIGCFCWYRVTLNVHAKIQDSWAEENYMWVGAVWIILCVLVICMFFCLHDTITALINPEYWALDKILGTLKPSQP